jgi:hypothetical protein
VTTHSKIRRTEWGAALVLIAVLACCGCGAASTSAAPVPADTTNAHANANSAGGEYVPHFREADDVARFLSGLPSRPGSAFAALEDTEIWKDHRGKLDESWKRAETDFVGGMRAFGEGTVKQGTGANLPLFYPFGGPDALTAVLFFPQSPEYVLVALEPPGTLPTAAQIQKKKDLPLFLGAIRESMASVLGRSFFVTRQMDKEFRGQLADGLMVPILSLLVRTDHHILGLRLVRVDEEGHVVAWPADDATDAKFKNKGVEIEFQGANAAPQRLYYFSVNLDDKHLERNRGFEAYVKVQGQVKTLLKATSYMTHHPEFSIIRNEILAQSEAVLQDDSGIPYKFFDPAVWQVRLFGEYERPYGSFRWLEQPELRQAYQSPGVEKLPFRIGYGFHRVPSNLLLARRLTTAARVQAANK